LIEQITPAFWLVQGRQEDLRSVVTSLRATFGVDYIYCWHGLPAYWSGISLEVRRASLRLIVHSVTIAPYS